MRHFVSHLSPGRGPFPSKFLSFGFSKAPPLSKNFFLYFFVFSRNSQDDQRKVFQRIPDGDTEVAATFDISRFGLHLSERKRSVNQKKKKKKKKRKNSHKRQPAMQFFHVEHIDCQCSFIIFSGTASSFHGCTS